MTPQPDTRPFLPLDSHGSVAGGSGPSLRFDRPTQASRPGTAGPAPTANRYGGQESHGSRRSGVATYTGTAVAINRRIESRRRLPTAQVATFRLERYDSRGDRRQPISVEMRGVTITGGISDGERVRVTGRMRGGVLSANEVYSLTTGARMSTRAMSLLEHRLGRRGALLVLGLVVVLAVVAVRFIPQIYYNTPFGKNEYRADVTGTCQRISSIRTQDLPPPIRVTDSTPGDLNSGVIYNRDTLYLVVHSRHDTIGEQYDILLNRVTPIALASRREVVKRLLTQEGQLFHLQEHQLQAMPAEISLSQLETVSMRTLAQQTDLTARLGAAMTALAGRPCAV